MTRDRQDRIIAWVKTLDFNKWEQLHFKDKDIFVYHYQNWNVYIKRVTITPTYQMLTPYLSYTISIDSVSPPRSLFAYSVNDDASLIATWNNLNRKFNKINELILEKLKEQFIYAIKSNETDDDA
jgi:hypothetical protein